MTKLSLFQTSSFLARNSSKNLPRKRWMSLEGLPRKLQQQPASLPSSMVVRSVSTADSWRLSGHSPCMVSAVPQATQLTVATRWQSSSTTVASTSTTSPFASEKKNEDTTTNNNDNGDDKNSKKSDSNIFLDNLGTIFLTVIGLIIASLVRSFYGSTRKNTLRSKLEEASALDPLEVDDLRFANPHISVPVFTALIADVRQAFPDGQATYREVVHVVRQKLQSEHRIPTIELGYLLDRVALHICQEQATSSTQPQPVTLWLVLLSLALNAPVPDRIRVLYEILATEKGSADNNSTSPLVTLLQVRDLVAYLQSTSQLVLDTQVIPRENQAYPRQAYHRGSRDELVRWDGGGLHDPIDIDALAAILRSKSVCAWGECYSKKKFT